MPPLNSFHREVIESRLNRGVFDPTDRQVRAMSRVPEYEVWSRALAENPLARDMCFEAIGYARGHCDSHGVGSGDAVEFGLAFAVLVARRISRPAIYQAWDNWRMGREIHDLSPISTNTGR